METLLEQQRRYHEERERLVDALVQERLGEKKTHKDAINSEHRQRAMLERLGYCAICSEFYFTQVYLYEYWWVVLVRLSPLLLNFGFCYT